MSTALILILPNPAAACRLGEVQKISAVTHPSGGAGEALTLDTRYPADHQSAFLETHEPVGTPSGDPRGDTSNYHGGTVVFVEVKEYWLDITGDEFDLRGVNGYIGGGVGGVLYQTKNGVHNPIAQNIENFQVEYNGDLDASTGNWTGSRRGTIPGP